MPDWLQDLTLPVFPEGLASSVVTTVWVGVWVIGFFNLRLGWVLSGLVVPGYLVPLLIVKPWAAIAVFIEASATYGLVWVFSERASGGRSWSSVFGRDRFLALVLVSVVVRLVFDTWLLPATAEAASAWWGLTLDWRNNLYSFGLIVIALLANQFWKPGFWRGLGPVFLSLGLTFVIVRYGLMEFTNFRMSGVSYLYEGYAASILASPKSYIILIVTAIVASRMNLLYGWEFGGILIPALIALQWYQPIKVAASFVEAFVIFGIGALLLRLPLFADITMEGARKLLLFFNIAFAYRLVLGWALDLADVDVQVTDYYGFGYLLSTLMAIKMYDKNMVERFTRSTLQISITGAAIGTAVGFLMTLAPASMIGSESRAVAARTPQAAVVEAGGGLPDAAAAQAVALYGRIEPYAPQAEGREVEAFAEGLRLTAEGALAEAAERLAGAGFSLERREEWLVARDVRGEGARGFYALAAGPAGPLAVAAPEPVAAPGLAVLAALVATSQDARGLRLGGAEPPVVGAPEPARPFARAFDVALGGTATLELRSGAEGGEEARLLVEGEVPEGLDPDALGGVLPGLETRFGDAGGVALSLRVGREAANAALAAAAEAERVVEERQLAAFLRARADVPVAPMDYVAPTLGQLRYLDVEVLTPILTALGGERIDPVLLAAADRAASFLGYSVLLHRHETAGRAHVVLMETSPAPGRRWGTYAFRVGGGAPYIVQAPRPATELNTLDYALALNDQLDARALMLASSDPATGPGLPADVLGPAAAPSLFSLVNQAILRESGDEPLMVVQSRALGLPEEGGLPPEDALLALSETPVGDKGAGELAERLLGLLRASGLGVRLVSGDAATAGYGVGWIPQALYAGRSANKEFAVLWVSPIARAAFAARTEPGTLETRQFAALGVETLPLSVFDYLEAAPPSTSAVSEDARALVDAYLERSDILALRRAQAVGSDTRLVRLASPDSGQTFLAIETEGRPAAIANLAPLDVTTEVVAPGADVDWETVNRFVDTRTAWLLFGEGG